MRRMKVVQTFGEALLERLHPLDQPPRVLLARPILLLQQTSDCANVALRALESVTRCLCRLLPLPITAHLRH